MATSRTFDPAIVIRCYRDIIQDRNQTKCQELRAEYESIAHRLREIWQYWRGSDDLHQIALNEASADERAIEEQSEPLHSNGSL